MALKGKQHREGITLEENKVSEKPPCEKRKKKPN